MSSVDIKHQRELAARRSIHIIFNLIQDRIADANRQSIIDDMYRMFIESDQKLMIEMPLTRKPE